MDNQANSGGWLTDLVTLVEKKQNEVALGTGLIQYHWSGARTHWMRHFPQTL